MQSSHAVLLDAEVNLPGVQTVHVDSPLLAEYVPGKHDVGCVEPVAQDDPAGHISHWSALARPVAFEKVPLSHGSAAVAPSVPVASEPSQYLPAPHGWG